MNDALLRTVAALQAKSVLLHDQSDALTELSDMQALRGFKSGLAEYISDHAQKGTLPPDPLATIRERLKPIIENLDRIRDQESVIEGVSKCGVCQKRIPAVSLRLMAEAQGNLDACRPALCQMHVDLFEGSVAEDWDGEVGERRISPEIRECAAVLFPDRELGYRESSLKESVQRIDELSLRIRELRELHTAQSAVADEASALLDNQDFRSAISLLQEHKMINGKASSAFTSASQFKDISVPVRQINKLSSACPDLKNDVSRLRDASVRDRVRRRIQRARNLITSPDGEFAREAVPLIAQLEEQLRVADAEAEEQLRVADARVKKGKIVRRSVAVLVIVIAIIVINSAHQAGLENKREVRAARAEQASRLQASRLQAESKAEQARLEAERESERRILELSLVREEFRLTQTTGGTVVAWGRNPSGQTTVPAGLEDVVQISGGDFHSLALREDGTVVAWGRNDYGQTTVPAGLEDVVQISGGSFHSLALREDGKVVAWGRNDYGQTTVPAGLEDVVQISGGYDHSLALREDGKVVAWGNNLYGKTTVPAGPADVVQISGGAFHSLALREDGKVVAWGSNTYGKTRVPAGLEDVVQISGGGNHSLALREDGKVVAWGDNLYGQTTVPADLEDVVQISGGSFHSLALREDGKVVAWGQNGHGQTTVPAGLEDIVQISGGGNHSLTLKRKR